MKRALSILAASMLLGVLGAAPAHAAFGFDDFEVAFTNSNGTPATLAGSHPYEMKVTLSVNTRVDEDETEIPEGETKDLFVNLPEGFIGDPQATPRCTAAEFVDIDHELSLPACPDGAAVGIVAVEAEFTPFKVGEADYFYFPVYNLVPPPGVPAKFGFIALGVPVTFESTVSQTPPYNLLASVTNISQALVFYGSELTLWGNPADPAHDPYRGGCITVKPGELVSNGNCEADFTPRPFLTLPRSCPGSLTTTMAADSWENPGAFVATSASTAGMIDCGKLIFGPTVEVAPTTQAAESPSGLEVSLDVKDEGLTSPTGRASSDIRKTVVTLPEGMTANPSAAEGLAVCTKAQYEAAALSGPSCPAASKLGTVTVTTPLLQESVEGSLYIAQQDDPSTTQPGAENPFDSLLAAYLVLRNENLGVFVKQAGKIEPDLRTGQIVSTFDEIPQFPLSHIGVRFREGPRAPLVTPPTCGTYTTRAELTPWANPATSVPASSEFKISSGVGGGPCPAGGVPPFKPGFTAGSINNNAGSFSPFYMRLTRQDGEQDMTRFDSILPPGLTGKLAGVAKCADAAIEAAKSKTGRQEQATPSCPASSQIGHVIAGAGVGPALTYARGEIYLAGPYGGDPLSLAVITPAVAGPFDAGTIVTREALSLDPTTGEVQVDGAASDPIPHILKGIPLKVREIEVYVDRSNFTLNPTSCAPLAVRATLFGGFADVFSSADDVGVPLSSRYQAANCANLGFKPKLSLKLTGGTRRNDHPALHSVLTPRPGDANIAKAVVKLPGTEFIDNAHIRNPCTRVQFNQDKCPKGSLLGRARAFTPLLDAPLQGPVYFRSNGGERLLPDIVADLGGQFRIILVGHVDSVKGRLRTIFEKTPDAPVTKFTLDLKGGKQGLLVNSANLCAHTQRAAVQLTGQNGKRHAFNPVLKNSCKKKKATTRR